jgi:hypothetical protein
MKNLLGKPSFRLQVPHDCTKIEAEADKPSGLPARSDVAVHPSKQVRATNLCRHVGEGRWVTRCVLAIESPETCSVGSSVTVTESHVTSASSQLFPDILPPPGH